MFHCSEWECGKGESCKGYRGGTEKCHATVLVTRQALPALCIEAEEGAEQHRPPLGHSPKTNGGISCRSDPPGFVPIQKCRKAEETQIEEGCDKDRGD